MGERDDEPVAIEQTRDRMSEIIEELARRATPGYLGNQIKEATVKKTREVRERAMASPTVLAVIGGAIGAAAGAFLARSRAPVPEYHYTGIDVNVDADIDEPGIGEAAVERVRDAKEKAGETLRHAGERGAEVIGDAKDRVADAGDRAANWLAEAWDAQPLLCSAGLVVVGALAAAMIPVPDKERELAGGVRKKASEGIAKLGEQIEEAIADNVPSMNKDGLDGAGMGFEAGDGLDRDRDFPPIH